MKHFTRGYPTTVFHKLAPNDGDALFTMLHISTRWRILMAGIILTQQNFTAEVLSASVPVLVDFWAPWCGPCKMIAPVVDELAQEYAGKLKVGKLNTDENLDIASKYQITSIPSLLIFKDGKPVQKIIGFKPKAELKKVIESALE